MVWCILKHSSVDGRLKIHSDILKKKKEKRFWGLKIKKFITSQHCFLLTRSQCPKFVYATVKHTIAAICLNNPHIAVTAYAAVVLSRIATKSQFIFLNLQ